MANKAFGIQGADLTLGGLNLQAGTNGVVIPGVTQAANYRVEEVDDRGDQTYNTYTEITVIDKALYDAIVGQVDDSHFADYITELDDEGYIDDIKVGGSGTYTAAEADRAALNDMYAYIGTGQGSDRPLVPVDWIQIPFRPKMRAGEVENVGGGGGSLTVGNGTNASIQNVTEILINGEITQVDDGVVGITILSSSGLTDITGAQIGNQITINTTIDGTTPDLANASSIDYIPTTTLNANDWIGSGTNDPGTYSTVRFADGSTFSINGWNTDAYPDTGNGTSGFISLDMGGLFYTGAQVWPITITSYNYVAGTTPGRGIEVDGIVWKFDQDSILTVPGEIQSVGLNNLALRSKNNINLYAGDVPGDDVEGGDINIYAGKGDPDNGGGDVQIRGGQAGDLYGQGDFGNAGGYVQLRGGYSVGTSDGGYVELRAGASERGDGGDVRIYSGFGSDGMLKLDNVAITNISLDTPVRVTLAVDHNLNDGDAINFADITTTVQLNNTKYYVFSIDNNNINLFQDRALTIPVSGAGMTPYSSLGVLTVTATSANAQNNNFFTQFLSNVPELGSVQVGWTVTGPGLNGTKTVTAIDPVDPVVITVDGSDGSAFSEFQSYTFAEPSTTGSGTAYTSGHGGDITLQPGSTYNSAWGDIGRTLIQGETLIGNEGGNIWKFGIDGKTTFPTLSVDLHNGGIQPGQVLQFADPTKQAIISGPAPTGENDAQRLIIQGHRATGAGEGGDVYLWAGDSDSNGGDIKIYAGDADAVPGNGGYINIDAGNGYANGGDVTITAGGSALSGGNVRITSGAATQGTSGRVEISSAGLSWMFGADGSLTLPSGSPILFGNGNSRIQAGMGFHINSEEGISLESVNTADPLNPVSHAWYFGPDGRLTFSDNTIQTTAWAGGRVVTAPASSMGSAGNKQGDLAFDGSYMYYCTQDFAAGPYSTTIVTTHSGQFPSIVKGNIPQPQAGWAFVYNGTTYTLDSNATEGNPGEWMCPLTTSISVTAGDSITVGPVFTADIWKRVAWGVDTW